MSTHLSLPPVPTGPNEIAESFKGFTQRLKVDQQFASRIHRFRVEMATRNPDHVAFLGSNLLGVYPFRFTERQRDSWFDDVIRIGEVEFDQVISTISYIKPDWIRISDAMNQSCVWLLHVLYHCNLPKKYKEQAMMDVATIFQYKLLSSTLAHVFKYPADRAVAQATADAMSRKFLLKQEGSWGAVVEYRSKEILSLMAEPSVHQGAIMYHAPDEAVGYMITDVQQRLKDYVKNLTDLFYQIRAKGVAVYTTSATIDVAGETLVKDKTRDFSKYRRYIHEVLSDRKTFVKDELVKIIVTAQHTTPEPRLIEALNWLSDNHRVPGAPQVERLVDETIVHAYNLIKSESALRTSRSILAPLITRLRALYMASRMADPTLLEMKELGDKIVKQCVTSKNESVLSSVRTAMTLYIVLRAFTMEHYS